VRPMHRQLGCSPPMGFSPAKDFPEIHGPLRVPGCLVSTLTIRGSSCCTRGCYFQMIAARTGENSSLGVKAVWLLQFLLNSVTYSMVVDTNKSVALQIFMSTRQPVDSSGSSNPSYQSPNHTAQLSMEGSAGSGRSKQAWWHATASSLRLPGQRDADNTSSVFSRPAPMSFYASP
jgi:hypothetical protein